MSYVFISYSRKDSQYAHTFADYLLEHGFDVWIDDQRIGYGVNWWEALVQGLRGCAALSVIMTPASRASEWVQREVFLALHWRKPIFPLLRSGENWELFILTQYVDVTDGRLPPPEFLERLSSVLAPAAVGRNVTVMAPPLQPPTAPAIRALWEEDRSREEEAVGAPELERPAAAVPPAPFDLSHAVARFREAFSSQDWAAALDELGRIRASGQEPASLDLDAYERRVRVAIEREIRPR